MALFEFITAGFVFGLAAGLSPGPLFALVVSETMRSGLRAGIKLAFVPLATDLPLLLLTLFAFSQLVHVERSLGVISLLGAAVLLYIAYETITTKSITVRRKQKPVTFGQGVLLNFLNPHPYIFFLTVGAATLTRALSESILAVVAFASAFLSMLVLSKVLIAYGTHRSRALLTGKPYLYVIRGLGILLVVFALRLAYDGIQFLHA